MDLLDATLISSIESSINLYLKARPRAQQRLNELAGQSLRVTLEPSGQQTVILFAIDQIRVLREFEGDVTTEISGELSKLIQMAKEPRSVMFGQGVRVSGDSALLQRLQNALAEPELDLEQWLANTIGDLPASAISQQVKAVMRGLNSATDSLQRSTSEYLQEELKALPSKVEVEAFSSEVQTLRNQVDLLARRVARILKD